MVNILPTEVVMQTYEKFDPSTMSLGHVDHKPGNPPPVVSVSLGNDTYAKGPLDSIFTDSFGNKYYRIIIHQQEDGTGEPQFITGRAIEPPQTTKSKKTRVGVRTPVPVQKHI